MLSGYGFTPGSDRLIFKAIIGYAFPVPGKNNDAGAASNFMTVGTQPRSAPNPPAWKIGFFSVASRATWLSGSKRHLMRCKDMSEVEVKADSKANAKFSRV
jgi:hypothetical protein